MLTSESNLECCNKKIFFFFFLRRKKSKLVFKKPIEQGRCKIYDDVNILETCEYLKLVTQLSEVLIFMILTSYLQTHINRFFF